MREGHEVATGGTADDPTIRRVVPLLRACRLPGRVRRCGVRHCGDSAWILLAGTLCGGGGPPSVGGGERPRHLLWGCLGLLSTSVGVFGSLFGGFGGCLATSLSHLGLWRGVICPQLFVGGAEDSSDPSSRHLRSPQHGSLSHSSPSVSCRSSIYCYPSGNWYTLLMVNI